MEDNNRYYLRQYSTHECSRLWRGDPSKDLLNLLWWLSWQALGKEPAIFGSGADEFYTIPDLEAGRWHSSNMYPSCPEPDLKLVLTKLAKIYPSNILLDLKDCQFEDDLGRLLVSSKDILAASCIMLLVTVRGLDLTFGPEEKPS